MTSLFCSASTTASCTHFIAVSKSTISPLRTPRDGAWPTPRILSVPSGRLSPTTTQILEVPISRPTIKLLFAIPVTHFSFFGYELPLERAQKERAISALQIRFFVRPDPGEPGFLADAPGLLSKSAARQPAPLCR